MNSGPYTAQIQRALIALLSGNNTWTGTNTFVTPPVGAGTVTSVSVVTANGVSGSVATATTTPAITLALGDITPTAVTFVNGASRTLKIDDSATDVVGRNLNVAAGSTVAGTSVSDVNGGDMTIRSGLGTGTGTSSIIFRTGTTLTTGKTLQTLSTKMTILGSGNVGIGTTTPVQLLHVQSADTATYSPTTLFANLAAATVRSNVASTGVGSQLELTAFNGGANQGVWKIASISTATNFKNALVFQTRTGSATAAERMRISEDGFVGIGTTSPGVALDVVGAITSSTVGTFATAKLTTQPAFVAGDKYLVIDASGNIHVSAIGPAS